MGLIIYPVFQAEIPAPEPRTTGEFLGREFETLDEVAEEHGLTRLTAFTDQREIPPDFDGSPDDLNEVLGPCNDWFMASEGREALSALARLLRSDEDAAERLEAPDEVVAELEDLARIIAVAEGAGVGFRLEAMS